jgi:hypothetical protein
MRGRRVLTGLGFLVLLGAPPTLAGDEPLLQASYSGSREPGAPGPEFMEVMESRRVQEALLSFARGPQEAGVFAAALRGTGFAPSDLEDLGLIRRYGDRYALDFWLSTAEDTDRIRAVAEVEGRGLAAAVLERRAEIEAILDRIPQPGADPGTLAFFLIGCVSLDWDGLNLTAEKGYRTEPGPGQYLPRAREPGGGGSRRGLYWGSHNMHLPIAVTTFGDHDAPRYGFPDLLWRMSEALDGMEPPPALAPSLSKLVEGWHGALLQQVGTIMLHVRHGDRSREELARAAGITEDDANALLGLLTALEYLREVPDGRLRATIPVLTERDAAPVSDLRRLGRAVMGRWLEDRHDALRQALADLTAVRQGVPLAHNFYWVWHYLFAVANRTLVEAGLFADPYAPGRRYPGYVSAVYRLSVVMGPLDGEEE